MQRVRPDNVIQADEGSVEYVLTSSDDDVLNALADMPLDKSELDVDGTEGTTLDDDDAKIDASVQETVTPNDAKVEIPIPEHAHLDVNTEENGATIEDWDEKRIYAFVIAEAARFSRHIARALPEKSDEVVVPELSDIDDARVIGNASDKRLPPGPPLGSTVIIPAGRQAASIRRVVTNGLQALIGALRNRPWTWQDHDENSVELCQYIEAGISVTDLRAAGILQTYTDLCTRFRFTAADLAVNRLIFSASQLVNLFHVTWKELLIDFVVSPFVYMRVLKLPIEDMATLGITKEILLQWDARNVFAEYQRILPGTLDGYSDPHIANLHAPLDRAMFAACPHYSPSDWSMYMGLDLRDLETLGVTGNDLWELWHRDFASVGDILRQFGWDPKSSASAPPHAFRFIKPKRAPSKTHARSASDYVPMPGSLRQLNAQRGVGDIANGAMWQPEEHLLFDDQDSDDDDDDDDSSDSGEMRSSRHTSATSRPESRQGHRRHKRDTRQKHRDVRGHRRRRKDHNREDDIDDSEFGDFIPAISSLLIGAPPSDDKHRANRHRDDRDNRRRRKRNPKPKNVDMLSALDDSQ